jgi:hypothetical protein
MLETWWGQLLFWGTLIVLAFVGMGRECEHCKVTMSLDGKAVLGYGDGIGNGHDERCPAYRKLTADERQARHLR